MQGVHRDRHHRPLLSFARQRVLLADPGRPGAGLLLVHFPDWTLQLFKGAGSIRESLISGNWPARYEVVLRALVDERQIVYMGFVLATRIVVGLLIMLVYKLIGGGRRKTSDFGATPLS